MYMPMKMNMKMVISIIKLLLLVAITLGASAYVYFFQYGLIEQFSTLEGVNHFLAEYKAVSIFAYIGLQVAQVVISILPGQIVQFAGGYAYGFWLGYLFSMAGIALGSSIAFGLARVLGRDAMHLLFGEDRVSRFVTQLNSRKAFAILVVIYAVPGLPKDTITYVAGISEFGYLRFLTLSMIARTPALMGTIMFGSMVNKGSYTGLILLASLAVILCIVLLIYRHSLTHVIDRLYRKFIEPKEDDEWED